MQCIPASPIQRRRRFPERELLERLRHYEGLLRQHNIKFNPLHGDTPAAKREPPKAKAGVATGAGKGEPLYEAKNIWDAMNPRTQPDPKDDDDDGSNSSHEWDELSEPVAKKAWDQFESNHHLLFSSRKTAVDLSALHPEQVKIFKLWQIYLENVDPLLKVTHTPTLQDRIIDAASNMANIKPPLEALMFSIYCMSIVSLVEEDCRAIFGVPKRDLLAKYHFGCQQALLNCEFLRSQDRECLTASYLYLVSVRPYTDPQSLSSMLGLAIRIARRMGLHSEAANSKCGAIEAEMRRRLWWSLILFDSRICETAIYKAEMLVPTWDCSTPLNVNDFDLQPEMKDPPAVWGKSNTTEAIFAVMRSEIGEFTRHSAFHLDFINPALKKIAKDVQNGPIPEGGELVKLEKMIEDRYLKFCNPENSLHFMTIWSARSLLAKNHLIEHYSRVSMPTSSSMEQKTGARCDAATSYALSMVESDTKLMTSPLTKRYRWFIELHFPFPAYVHVFQELRKRPVRDNTRQIWEIMSGNCKARGMFSDPDDNSPTTSNNPFFKVLSKMVLQAWEACEIAYNQAGKPAVPPRIVSEVQQKVAQTTQTCARKQSANNNIIIEGEQADGGDDNNKNKSNNNICGMGILDDFSISMDFEGLEAYPSLSVPDMDIDGNQLDWDTIMNWHPVGRME